MATSVDLERARIRVIDGRLVIRGGFAPGDENRYTNALFNYFSMGSQSYEIDLSGIGGICKPVVDQTVSFAQFAGVMGREVVVVAGDATAHALRLAGYDRVGRLRVVEG